MNYTSREVYEFISQQTNNPIVEWKTCAVSGTEFPIYQSDLNFYDKISPTFAGQRFQIPTPTLCPEERQRRRLMFRNERKLYKRLCDFSGKSIISTYPAHSVYKIYDQKVWRSDERNPMDYGFDFDFTKTFSENFKELTLKVPKCNLLTDYNKLERSDFVHLAGESKDCYLIMETDRCEKCMYGYAIFDCIGCIDCNNCANCQHCFECIGCKDSFQLLYSYQCYTCKDSMACVNCSNISNCFGCYNLTSGEYMIYNKQHTKEEYESFVAQLDPSQLSAMIYEVMQKAPCKHISGTGNNSPTYGSYINNSQNAVFCYDTDELRDCKYCTIIGQSQDCMDYLSRGLHSSLMYESHNCGQNCHHLLFCDFVRDGSSSVLYSHLCPGNNKNLFGCVGLRNKQYCIFNKQYSKEEYETQVAKIIAHMQSTGERGEFFYPSLSPFGYNETIAQEYYPLEKDNALQRGLKREDLEYPINIPEGMQTINAENLPPINEVNDTILNQAILCSISNKPFRIMKFELDFYRKYKLPLPTTHPDIRHYHRTLLRPEKVLHMRSCDQCQIPITSVYSSAYPTPIYCENCYNKIIY